MFLGLLAGLVLAACGGGGGSIPTGCHGAPTATCALTGPYVSVWTTWPDRTKLLAGDTGFVLAPGTSSGRTLNVDAAVRYQSMVGFGAAMTDASVLNLTSHLDAATRTALFSELFGRTNGGLGLSLMRLPIGASDFSTSQYTYDDMPAGQSDPTLAAFSTAPLEAGALPLLKDALAINPSLRVIGSAWSAPAWMKTNDSLVAVPGITGTLRTDAFDAYARYLGRVADAMEQGGVPLYGLTLGNEPGYEPADYPGMRLASADRATLLAQNVGPLFAARPTPVRLLEWDHNWDTPAEPLAVLGTPTALPYVAGVAWHCYAGAPGAMGPVHDAYPAVDAFVTECSGGGWAPVWQDNLVWFVDTLLIGSTRNWARGVVLWNLALDETGGPHTGGCTNCRGVVTIDSATGAITRNEEYYALAHLSRFVHPGAERIDSTTGVDGLDSVAFHNVDDGSIALIVVNTAAADRDFTIASAGHVATTTLKAGAVATYVWTP